MQRLAAPALSLLHLPTPSRVAAGDCSEASAASASWGEWGCAAAYSFRPVPPSIPPLPPPPLLFPPGASLLVIAEGQVAAVLRAVSLTADAMRELANTVGAEL